MAALTDIEIVVSRKEVKIKRPIGEGKTLVWTFTDPHEAYRFFNDGRTGVLTMFPEFEHLEDCVPEGWTNDGD